RHTRFSRDWSSDVCSSDLRKYEEIGTHPAANHNAVAAAIAFHRAIGSERKVARLRYLRDRWARRLLEEGNGRVSILTPLDSPDRSEERRVGKACRARGSRA